jgi:hypothetical protein
MPTRKVNFATDQEKFFDPETLEHVWECFPRRHTEHHVLKQDGES